MHEKNKDFDNLHLLKSLKCVWGPSSSDAGIDFQYVDLTIIEQSVMCDYYSINTIKHTNNNNKTSEWNQK